MSWKCPQCALSNYALKSKCTNCGCFRSKAIPLNAKVGDWTCSSCKDINFASRTECRKCKMPKNVENSNNPVINPVINPAIKKKPGDWDCSNCQELNFGSRVVCFKCGKDRVIIENKEKDKGKEEDTQDTQDNTCIICFEREINTVISICGHLGYCFECANNMSECPICRAPYDPDNNLVKVFKVK